MKMNAGAGDRIFRIILGLVLISAGIIFENYWGAIGLVPLLTGLILPVSMTGPGSGLAIIHRYPKKTCSDRWIKKITLFC